MKFVVYRDKLNTYVYISHIVLHLCFKAFIIFTTGIKRAFVLTA